MRTQGTFIQFSLSWSYRAIQSTTEHPSVSIALEINAALALSSHYLVPHVASLHKAKEK